VAVVPITARLNTPVDQIGDKALERARRDFQETVRASNINGLQTRTQTETGGQNDQRRNGGVPVPDESIRARIAPADPRDRANAQTARRGQNTPASQAQAPGFPQANPQANPQAGPQAGPQATPQGAPEAALQAAAPAMAPARNDAPGAVTARTARPLPEPIGPPIPRELLPQLPTPPPGSSLVAEGLSGRSDLIHKPVRAIGENQRVEAAGDDAWRDGETARAPQYRLNSAAPPEIAARIAAFMRTGQLDGRPFAVTPVPGLVRDDSESASQTQPAAEPTGTSAPAPTAPAAAAQAGNVDLLADFDRRARPQVMPTLPIPMQAQTIAMMPAGQFAPVRTADHRMPVAGVSQRVSDENEARDRERAAGLVGKSHPESANPFFTDTPFASAHPVNSPVPAAAGPVNPLFAR